MYHSMTIAGLERKLPLCRLNDDLKIGAFVIFGNVELTCACAKALLENPMILILDEPTNFLDENHINWLTQFLQNYENAFILVSHDIPFLTNVTNVIYHLENTTLTRYKGTYNDFLRMYDIKKHGKRGYKIIELD